MLKQFSIICILCLHLAKTNNIYAQQTPLIPFEGCISYQDMVKSKASGGVTYRSTKLFFKQGFYKAEIMANTTKNLEIYTGKDTLFSFPLPLGKYIWWADVRESKDTILNFEITENVADIAGHKCNLLKITSKQLNINYYYSSKIYIDPQPFSKHALRHFGFCLEKTKGALPLKVIYEYPKHTIEMQALNIEKQKYESWHFQVPRDKILVPNKF